MYQNISLQAERNVINFPCHVKLSSSKMFASSIDIPELMNNIKIKFLINLL